MPEWTDAQKEAIEARNESVLVSAAAGSGKTSVLVEHVMRLLEEGRDIDRMLIITFTRAAASELRARIAGKIDEASANSPHMRRQFFRIGRANISTLHMFCHHILRRHFQAADVDPTAHVGEEPAIAALRRRAVDEAMEALCERAVLALDSVTCEQDETDSASLVSRFSDDQITDMCGKLYRFIMAQADPWGWIDRQLEETGRESTEKCVWAAILRDESLLLLSGARQLCEKCGEILACLNGPLRYEAVYQADLALISRMREEILDGTFVSGKASFSRLPVSRAKEGESGKLTEQFKSFRAEMKKRVLEAAEMLPGDMGGAVKDIVHTLPALRALAALVRDMHIRFSKLKEERNLLDFFDLEHKALLALSDDAVRKEAAGQFDALFVDEYQDISGIQEAIINAVHQGNSLFMVGDIKQSIYRFRLADPALFMRKYESYSRDEKANERKIVLTENFRSRGNILSAVNDVFRNAMRRTVTEIEYDNDAMLRPGRETSNDPPVSLHIIEKQVDEGENETGELSKGYLYEAQVAVRIISDLLNKKIRGQDGSEHRLQYRDMVILLRNVSGRAPQIARVLTDNGIPVFSDADAQYFDLPEVADMLNILRIIDNPLQDIPLLSILRCPCFRFTNEELACIRLSYAEEKSFFYEAFFSLNGKDEHVTRTIQTLDKWRFLSNHLTVEELMWKLLSESGIYTCAGALPGGDLRRANLRLLCERAQSETALEGVHAFLGEVETARMSDDTRSAKTLGEQEDVVRIMTLHKSKGLEFPVVILMELAREFRMPSDKENLLLDAEVGMAMKFIDEKTRIMHETAAGRAIALKKAREQRAEEARLLYVGMTRAREYLCLLASPRHMDSAEARWAFPSGDYAAGTARSMLDWIGQSLCEGLALRRDTRVTGENGSWFDIFRHDASSFKQTPPPVQRAEMPDIQGPPREDIARILSRKVLPASAPVKTSVTAMMKKRLRTEEDMIETPDDKRHAFLSEAFPPPRPRFLTDARFLAVDRGTATHKALCALPLDVLRGISGEELRSAVSSALSRLADKGVLLPAEKEAVREEWVYTFLDSPLGRQMLSARAVKREWPFVLRTEEGTIVQGVIDCCFLDDGAWILCDYKTDNLGANEIRERYGGQVSFYARALREITGKPVKKVILYALRAGIEIEVE